VPAPAAVQVKEKGWFVLAAMTVEPGVAAVHVAEAPVPAAVGVTVTPFADAPPAGAEFWTLATSAMTWPALTVSGGWAANDTASPDPARTVVAGVEAIAAVSAVPVFAAVPFAVAVKTRVPAPAAVQVNVKAWVVLAAMVVAPGAAVEHVAEAPAPVAVGVTVTPFAGAPPAGAVFWTFAMSVMTWPELTGDGGWAAKVTVSAAGPWMLTTVDVEFVVSDVPGTFASTQVAKPEMGSSCWVAGAVHPVQVRACVAVTLFTGRDGATAHDPA